MTESPAPGGPGPAGRPWYSWLAGGTFVLGVLVGVLALGLLQDGPAAAPDQQQIAGEPADAGAEQGGGSTAGIQVNEACLRAINAARDVSSVVDDLGTAAASLDTAQLDEAIRRLQPLQARLQQNSRDCETMGTVPDEADAAPGTAGSSASPTG